MASETQGHWARNALVFLVVAAVYLSCPIKGPSDLIWSIPTVFSMLREGNADIDEYQPAFKEFNDHGVLLVKGHYRNYFPMGPALLALVPLWLFNHAVNAIAPLVQPFPKAAKGISNWQKNFNRVGTIDVSFYVVTEMVFASLLMALAALFVQLMASELMPWKRALVVTGIFSLCSSVWSTASRDLGQHGPSVLMLSIALWLLVRGRRKPRGVALAGLFVALSYVMRPTNSLSVIFLTLLVAVRYRRYFVPYLGFALAVAIPFCAYNASVYGSIFPPYYRPERVIPAGAGIFFEALAGNLVSPARGLLVFSPVFLFAGYGFYLEWKAGRERSTLMGVALIFLLHWFTVSSFPHWWAGHSFGPRFMTDMTPYLCYLLVPVVGCLREPWQAGARQRGWVIAFAVACLWSSFTHLRGSTSWPVSEWNARPEGQDVDQHPERIWDFRDPPFFRGL